MFLLGILAVDILVVLLPFQRKPTSLVQDVPLLVKTNGGISAIDGRK